jgi:FAD/FMN-containing dehydrogenase
VVIRYRVLSGYRSKYNAPSLSEMQITRRTKAALDPQGIMNPAKVL